MAISCLLQPFADANETTGQEMKKFWNCSVLLWLWIAVAIWPHGFRARWIAQAWELCHVPHLKDATDSSDEADETDSPQYYCPNGNTCCSLQDGGFGCIPSRSQDPPNATRACCLNDVFDTSHGELYNQDRASSGAATGCPYGYHCGRWPTSLNDQVGPLRSNHFLGHPVCLLDPDAPPTPSPVPMTNRYHLCSIPDPSMMDLHGFPMGKNARTNHSSVDPFTAHDRLQRKLPVGGPDEKTSNTTNRKQLLYYSNMGNIQVPDYAHTLVKRVVIIIHGSARNADDYFCTGVSLLDDMEGEPTGSGTTLVLAPWFAAPSDLPSVRRFPDLLYHPDNNSTLVWAEKADREHPLAHSWRYGADALNAPNVSSYYALDQLVEFFTGAARQYPSLESVVVAGHSAGGQIVHRWALLSNSHAWQHDDQRREQSITLRAVVANPRSYAYLDGRRRLPSASELSPLRYPSQEERNDCPTYNTWPWGLEAGEGFLEVPYKKHALEETPVAQVIARYTSERTVIYLSGEWDQEVLMDRCATSQFQGPNRRVRALHYFASLQEELGDGLLHELHFVPGSPHDHMLMFQSPQGRQAIFG